MNTRNTLLWVFAAAALFAYIWTYERPAPGTQSAAASARAVFADFDAGQVRAIQITRSDQAIRVEKRQGRWWLTQPEYPANPQAVEAWLRTLGESTVQAWVPPEEVRQQPNGPVVFGLDPPRAEIAVELSSGRLEFNVGGDTVAGEKVYLKRAGDEGVCVTDAALWERLPTSAEAWRTRQFISLSGLGADRMRVQTPGGAFEVVRDADGTGWRLTQPRAARADSSKLEQVLQQLQSTRVTAFAADRPGADLEPFGLDDPALGLSFFAGTNLVGEAQFGRSPPDEPGLIYARRSGLENVVVVPRASADLLAAPYTEFLEYQLIDFTPESVNVIHVAAAEPFELKQQTDGRWRMVEPVAFPADPALVQAFMDQLRSLRVVDIAKEIVSDPDWTNYGLAPASRRYTLEHESAEGAAPQLIAQVEFGSRQGERICARRPDEPSVYLVPALDVLALPQAAFELRDRRLWQFSTNEVAALTIELGDDSYRLLRSPAGGWTFAPGSQGIVNTFALEEAVFRLGQTLRARAWVAQGEDRLAEYGFGAIRHHLTIELEASAGRAPLRLAFGATSPSGGPFAVAELEVGPVVFEFPAEIYLVYQEVLNSLSWRPTQAP